ncbi:MAG: ATP-dependent helicase [Planctomycetota bacterium]|nr:MAG: ATP-dependent helicase [Planctomycetota bacterium]
MHRHPDLPKAFAELGLEVPILRALVDMSYKEPSPIQREMVPQVLAGRDVLGQAKTGTGKTAAFGMPLLQMLDPNGRMQALVLTPTRELAAQVVGEFRRMAKYTQLHCVPVYGGVRMKEQLHQLGRRPHVVVGTPGRVMDMLQRRAFGLDELKVAVLDEVDRMLDIGFRDDIRKILGQIKHPHQTVFVSATLDEEIKRLAMQYMKDPVEVNVSKDEMTVEQVVQQFAVVDRWDKFRLLKLVLDQEKPKLAIVFCNTKHGARKLAQRLHAIGIDAREIHGDLVQQKRERIMERFRKHQIPVLVATDLAARGIDVNQISHIINYDLPQDTQIYVHRVGRTARMGASGKAITFVTREEGPELTKIEKLINKEISQIDVPGFEPSPPPEGHFDGGPRGRGRPGPAARPAPARSTPPTQPAAPKPTPSSPAAPVGVNLVGKVPLSRRRRR